MFEHLKLFGSPERSIVLETAKGHPIRNQIFPEPNLPDLRYFDRLRKENPSWTIRKEPCGRYNCFGLAWASRRTAILEDNALQMILDDDGYRRLQSGESPQLGDLAMYVDRDRGLRVHVGVVVRSDKIAPGATGSIWFVASKLGPTLGEVIHKLDDTAFLKQVYPLPEVEVWTDRRPN